MEVDPEPIEAAAQEVLDALGVPDGPIDPFAIAREEGIRLAAGDYGGSFDSRIEYRKKDNGRGRFFLFYAEAVPPWRPEGRVRFSLGHELGHYYLPEHREFVLTGDWHGSKTGFVSERRTEREADLFAAALLMPRSQFVEAVQLRCGGRCAMADLDKLSDIFQTSLTSTAFRYVRMDLEPCAVIVSSEGRVKSAVISDSMMGRGLSFIPHGHPVSKVSVTGRLHNIPSRSAGAQPSDVWFPDVDRTVPLWEEARQLGRTKLVLTLLVIHGDDVDNEDDDEQLEDRDE